jgi:hypothetical protein
VTVLELLLGIGALVCARFSRTPFVQDLPGFAVGKFCIQNTLKL